MIYVSEQWSEIQAEIFLCHWRIFKIPLPLPQTGEHVLAKIDDPNSIGITLGIKMKTQGVHVKKRRDQLQAAASICKEYRGKWAFGGNLMIESQT